MDDLQRLESQRRWLGAWRQARSCRNGAERTGRIAAAVVVTIDPVTDDIDLGELKAIALDAIRYVAELERLAERRTQPDAAAEVSAEVASVARQRAVLNPFRQSRVPATAAAMADESAALSLGIGPLDAVARRLGPAWREGDDIQPDAALARAFHAVSADPELLLRMSKSCAAPVADAARTHALAVLKNPQAVNAADGARVNETDSMSAAADVLERVSAWRYAPAPAPIEHREVRKPVAFDFRGAFETAKTRIEAAMSGVLSPLGLR
jgi:hypothetical protein